MNTKITTTCEFDWLRPVLRLIQTENSIGCRFSHPLRIAADWPNGFDRLGFSQGFE